MTGVKGKPDPNALRLTGWRPPLIEGKYQDLVFAIMERGQFRDQSTRAVIEAALRRFATEAELKEAGL